MSDKILFGTFHSFNRMTRKHLNGKTLFYGFITSACTSETPHVLENYILCIVMVWDTGESFYREQKSFPYIVILLDEVEIIQFECDALVVYKCKNNIFKQIRIGTSLTILQDNLF